MQPENTLASFAHAIELGVDAVEFDVHLTADQRLVVIHDERVDRTTNGTGEVAALTLAALRKLDAGAGESIPTLEEVLRAVPTDVTVNIELKGRNTAQPVASVVGEIRRPLLVSSFDHNALHRFHDLCPASACAPLVARWRGERPGPGRERIEEVARALGAWSVNLADRIATLEHVRAVRDWGCRCLVYTVNNAERARELHAMGVAGVFTDYPDRLLA